MTALAFLAEIALVLVLVEVARRLALASGAVARPNPIVRSHRKPVAYLGGAGLILGWVAILALLGEAGRETWLRAATALVFAAFGTWDDLRAFGPAFKFAVQGAIGAIYLALVGTPLDLVFGFRLLVLVTAINAFNLIDVMDGLLCLVSAIAVAGLLLAPGLAPGAMRPELLAMLAGLCALFLFNRPPARIYAGDAGSLTLGFLVGAWLIDAANQLPAPEALSLVGLCIAPAIELPLLMTARMSRGLSPFRGSPDHFALRLQDRLGWSKWQVLGATAIVGTAYAIGLPLAATSLPLPAFIGVAVLAAALGLAIGAALWRIPPTVAVARALPISPATAPTTK